MLLTSQPSRKQTIEQKLGVSLNKEELLKFGFGNYSDPSPIMSKAEKLPNKKIPSSDNMLPWRIKDYCQFPDCRLFMEWKTWFCCVCGVVVVHAVCLTMQIGWGSWSWPAGEYIFEQLNSYITQGMDWAERAVGQTAWQGKQQGY